MSRIYDDFQSAEQKRQTWRSYLKAGDTRRAANYLDANRGEIASVASSEDAGGSAGMLRQVDEALATITKMRRELAASKLPDSVKTAKLHGLGLERGIARDYYDRRGLLSDSQ